MADILSLDAILDTKAHQKFFKRGIPASFTDPVYRGMELECACLCPADSVGHGHSKVVMTMDTYLRFHCLFDLIYQIERSARVQYSHCISYTDVISTMLFRGFKDGFQDIDICTRSILCCEPDSEAMVFCIIKYVKSAGFRFFEGLMVLVFEM